MERDLLCRRFIKCATMAAVGSVVVVAAWAHPPGRMTGGGSILCTIDGVIQRVTHGFELHCGTGTNPEGSNPPGPNNLEINFDGGNNFHLDALTVANCSDDPTLVQSPPSAPIDTMTGIGTGTLNKVPAAISFTLTDAGEPGTADTMQFTIVTLSQPSVTVSCPVAALQFGNHQAHRATGAKQ